MLAGDLFLLVGPRMPERLMVIAQTKSSPPARRVMRLGCGLITHYLKKFMFTETAMSITEALLGMDTVTCETPEEVSHMRARVKANRKRVAGRCH